jgi:hypothetical protein
LNIREAILKTADLFERNPASYSFFANRKPACGSQGCMMGWIGWHLGVEESSQYTYMDDLKNRLGFDYCDIGNAIRDKRGVMEHVQWVGLMAFHKDAVAAAGVLRLFADERFPIAPAKRIQQPPDWQAMAATQTVGTDAISECARA